MSNGPAMDNESPSSAINAELQEQIKKSKAVKPATGDHQSTRLADLPTGEPDYGFVSGPEFRAERALNLLIDIESHLRRIAANTDRDV